MIYSSHLRYFCNPFRVLGFAVRPAEQCRDYRDLLYCQDEIQEFMKDSQAKNQLARYCLCHQVVDFFIISLASPLSRAHNEESIRNKLTHY